MSAPAWSYREEPGPPGSGFGPVHRFAEVDSTNRHLLDAARAGAPAGLVAVADHQTAGRGRLGRRWEAPPGANLLVSVLLRPGLAAGDLHLCTAAAALAAQAAVAETAGVAAEVKWPNDLLVAERKLAGILAESPGHEAAGWAVVVGLGCNVAWPPPAGSAGVPVPAEVADVATSLARESDRVPAVADLLAAWLAALGPLVALLGDDAGRRELAGRYRAACASLGRPVAVSLPDGETVSGVAVDLTDDGRLVVDTVAGPRTVSAGDLVYVRHR